VGSNDVIDVVVRVIDATGVAAIVTGAAIAFVIAAARLSRREPDVRGSFRQQLGQSTLLGLELLVAGDIIRTVGASPSLTSVAILAAIVLIRTFLSFSLEVELTGRWPWQKREVAPSGYGRRWTGQGQFESSARSGVEAEPSRQSAPWAPR
jgi:uncharacterized membrane protein